MVVQFQRGAALLAVLVIGGLAASGCDRKPTGSEKRSGPALNTKASPEATSINPGDKTPLTTDKAASIPTTVAPKRSPAARKKPLAKPPVDAVASNSKVESVSAAACQKACANVLKISMADLSSASPKVRGAIKKRVKVDCPKQCLQRGTKAAVKCLAKAKTAKELMACPR